MLKKYVQLNIFFNKYKENNFNLTRFFLNVDKKIIQLNSLFVNSTNCPPNYYTLSKYDLFNQLIFLA